METEKETKFCNKRSLGDEDDDRTLNTRLAQREREREKVYFPQKKEKEKEKEKASDTTVDDKNLSQRVTYGVVMVARTTAHCHHEVHFSDGAL